MSGRRRWLVGSAVLGLLAATAAGVAVRGSVGPPAAAPRGTPSVRFAEVERADIATTLSLDGTLGFGVERPVKGVSGRVTWLPATGAVVSRGEALFRVDDEPVTLFYGGTPLFRPLDATGLVGRDVKVVADNLKALGYAIGDQPSAGTSVPQPTTAPGSSAGAGGYGAGATSVKVRPGDAVLTASLVSAIKRWQAHDGRPQTGRLAADDIVVLPFPVRVSAVTAQPGDDASGALVSVTGTAKVVTVTVEATEAGAVRSAESVTVRLPDGTSAPAKVTDVSRTATASEGSGSGRAQLTATLTLDDPDAVRTLDSAPVQAVFAAQVHHGVLTVPVGALLALAEGGYAVQTDQGTLIPVETGLFDKGRVEVKGSGLSEGTRVVTTS